MLTLVAMSATPLEQASPTVPADQDLIAATEEGLSLQRRLSGSTVPTSSVGSVLSHDAGFLATSVNRLR